MTEIEKAYAAGLFDGEGTICTTCANPRWMPKLRVAVQMVDVATVKWFADTFGGHFTIARRPSATCRRTQYQWHAESKSAGVFLETLLPYLKTKRPQAERALALRAISRPRGGVMVPKIVPEDVLREGHRLRLEISNLNRSGSPDQTQTVA